MFAPQVQSKRVPDRGSAELEGALVLYCLAAAKFVWHVFFDCKSREWLNSFSKYVGARPWRLLNISMYFR